MNKRYVLVIDGGGVKSCSSTTILHYIETYLLSTIEMPIYNLFDLACGTSAGALIAACLLINKMRMYEIQQLYRKEYLEEFFSECDGGKSNIFNGQYYTGHGKRKILRTIFDNSQMCLSEKVLLVPVFDWERRCNVFYDSTTCDCNEDIVKVLDASSAALLYYPAVKLSNGHIGMDSGLFLNSPVYEAIERAKELWPNDELHVLSIGCGINYWGPPPNLKGVKKYLRLNEELFGASSNMDDYSLENIDYLRRNGNMWWFEHQNVIKRFFDF